MKISVVIPVRNEEGSIRTLLDSLLNQTLMPDEIVITDGGSVDATCCIIEEYIELGSPIRLIRDDAALPGRGRNLAAAQAQHEWLAFTDAGIRPLKNWLEALSKRVRETSSEVVYGAWEPIIDSNFKEAAAIAYVPPRSQVDVGMLRPRSIASAMILRQAWQSVGGFREDLRSGEDLLFMSNLDSAKFKIGYAPEAVVYWELQPTSYGTFRRFRTYSHNGMKAGLARQWQKRISQLYVLMVVALIAGIWWWPLFLIPILILLLRAARRIYRWYENEARWRRGIRICNPRRMLAVAGITLIIDLAMFCGMLDWLVKRPIKES
jgi:glycosyltransferase involved in cell wall biosynthesis